MARYKSQEQNSEEIAFGNSNMDQSDEQYIVSGGFDMSPDTTNIDMQNPDQLKECIHQMKMWIQLALKVSLSLTLKEQ